jgi:hypothetical protein
MNGARERGWGIRSLRRGGKKGRGGNKTISWAIYQEMSISRTDREIDILYRRASSAVVGGVQPNRKDMV